MQSTVECRSSRALDRIMITIIERRPSQTAAVSVLGSRITRLQPAPLSTPDWWLERWHDCIILLGANSCQHPYASLPRGGLRFLHSSLKSDQCRRHIPWVLVDFVVRKHTSDSPGGCNGYSTCVEAHCRSRVREASQGCPARFCGKRGRLRRRWLCRLWYQ
jgi:hypothetical protein